MSIDLNFPVPERIEYGDLVNFGYSDETVWPLKYALKKISRGFHRAIRRNRYFGLFDICIPKKIKVNKQIRIGNIDRDDIGTRIISGPGRNAHKFCFSAHGIPEKDKIELKFGLSRDLASKASTKPIFPFV